MSVWYGAVDLQMLRESCRNTMLEHLGIELTEMTEDSLIGTMPVDARTHQAFGMLHGGASVVLAESLGSLAANCCVDPERAYCVGMEVNANHIRSVRKGRVTGTASPVYLGPTSQIWEIRIVDQRRSLVCIARLTMAVQRQKAGRSTSLPERLRRQHSRHPG